VVVLHEKDGGKDTLQRWWQMLDLETGFTFHLGDDAFGMDRSDVLLCEV